MKLPKLNRPERYQGLFVFDFGDHVSVGYTAEEIEVLLSSPQFSHGRAYRIHRATAEGQLSLRGLSRADCSVRESLIFYRNSREQAEADYEVLIAAAPLNPPPAPVHWALGTDPDLDLPDYTILVYAAVASEHISRWLQGIGFAGGDHVEGGPRIADYYQRSAATRRRELAIAPDPRYHSRPARVVLETVHRPVQRELA